MATIQSTQLDFDAIKSSLKTYFAQQPEFTDYNFEAAGLSNLLDVLAYNTHMNGLIANFALNESFLTTAQLRSSVVSHSEALGYTPRSKTAAVAYLRLSIVNTTNGRSSIVTLPAYSKFTTSVDGISYNFQTIVPYYATDDGTGSYLFRTADGSINIPVYEGRQSTKTFFVGESTEDQIYVIPDDSVDTATLDVKVYDTVSGSSYKSYTSLKSAITIDATSTYYDLHESPNGFWEMHFSDGLTTGVAPKAGNKIVVNYLSSVGSTANGANRFVPVTTVTMDNATYNLLTTVQAPAAGGGDKETISSIRRNAPISFAAQQRLVTALDYKGVILANYGAVDDAIAWGGEDNIPAYYGKVLVSLIFADNVTTAAQQAIKDSIVANITNNLSIMAIDTQFLDPVVTFVGCQTYFNYNPNKSTISVGIAETQVTNNIISYFANNLGRFGGAFRRSNVLAEIDNLSDAILDSRMDVLLHRRFTPVLNTTTSYSIQFPVGLASPNSSTPIVTSNTFIYNSEPCTISNRLSDNVLQVVNATGLVKIDNVGSYNTGTGVVTLTGLNISSVVGYTANPEIKIYAVPANQATIKSSNNYVLELDLASSFAIGNLDYENTRIGI